MPAFAGMTKAAQIRLGKFKIAARALIGAGIKAIVVSAGGHAPVLRAASFIALVKGLLLGPVGAGHTCFISLGVPFGAGRSALGIDLGFAGNVAFVERLKAVLLLFRRTRRIALGVGICA